ncbi:hypothetical protein PHYBOEH_010135 [Phytophthora boehmeriae]|uniref:3'-5' exonuclease domain-containing protein n=1 Tax=Phytophthora boehmeriae TaxID=109152 RepID=A0A8T1WYD4_9STRA|nr:hypothetical protein PHYBOEH_010135 [Phytophthora boehmeriae]
MPELQEQLREIFAQRQQNGQTTAEQDATAAAQWCGCLHSSFYGANAAVRGVNKFLELETTLTQLFSLLSSQKLARILVDEAIETQDVKRAHRIVYNFGLREEYPDIDLMYCHDGLMKLIERQRWQMALSFAGNDTSLLKLLLHHVVAAGETQWAARLGDILKIPEIEGLCAQMGTQRSSSRRGRLTYSGNAAALNGWLSLGLGGEAIVFCNTEEALRAAMDHFLIRNPILIEGTGDDAVGANNTRFYNDQIVGLDVEWKPISSKIAATTGSTTTTAVASILQIASSTRVFIVDLLALHGNDFLFNTFLQRLFSSTSLLKVGFGFDSDLKVLHQTFPERPSLLRISPFLELSTVVSKLLNVSLEAPCVACIEANCKLDTAQLATLCGVSRRRIKFATFSECCESFGFEPGTIPPFGHRSGETIPPIKIYANSTLRHIQYLICGGGAHDSLLWLSSKAYFALIEVEAVGDIQRGFSAIEASISKEEVGISASETTSIAYKNMGYNSEYKFLADSMVARVGKWLRTIGMDVLIWDPYAVPKKKASQDHKAALLALSVCEQRILLTRDKKLANRRDAGACFVVSSDDPFQQFQEIKTHFALKLVKDEMMSRCSRCNAKGFDVVDLEYVRSQTEDEVHPNVLEVVTEFWVCRVCHKIYWEGPKYDSNYANLLRMFDEESIVGSDSEDATAHISPV